MSDSYISAELLDTVVSNEHIGKIASFLRNWEELSPHLELTPEKETEIRQTFRDYGVQKKEILLEWKRCCSHLQGLHRSSEIYVQCKVGRRCRKLVMEKERSRYSNVIYTKK